MITVGELNAFSAALQGLPVAQLTTVIAEKGQNLSDDATLASDALADIAALLPPPLSAYATLAAVLFALAALAATNSVITPDPNPIQDAQTTRNFDPGDPAARL